MTVSAPVRSNKDSSMEEVKHIENWAARNRMTLNLSKKWEMLLSGGGGNFQTTTRTHKWH